MFYFCMVLTLLFMIVGHFLKSKRWGLYISVYETPIFGNLLRALSVGHSVNVVMPFRIGDIIRIVLSGKRLKNGYSLSMATVIIDLYIDFFSVCIMFLGLKILGKGGVRLWQIGRLYWYVAMAVIPITTICFLNRKVVKKIISYIAKIFNENIEFCLLYVSYLAIASAKDILTKIQKQKFILYTVGIWAAYIASYIIFAEALQLKGFNYTTSDVFVKMFSAFNLFHLESKEFVIWAVFILVPLFLIYLYYKIENNKKGQMEDGREDRFVLPQMNKIDKLAFLRTYYQDDNRVNLKNYLEINKDVTVIRDNSAGSNASTILVIKDEKMYFRKYAFDEDAEKLIEQAEWIEDHQADIPLPIIVEKKQANNFAAYDMPSYSNAVGLFRYMHTMPVEKGWRVLQESLRDIEFGLHSKNKTSGDMDIINEYIESKVIRNLKIIETKNKYIIGLEKYDTIYVNGRQIKTLKNYRSMFNKEHMARIFSDDVYSDIHGDLTIENIVCLFDDHELDKKEYEGKVLPGKYYFIDPNTGNLHNSPFLDYAKLLQSLHGNYEFLMTVKSVSIEKDRVQFMMTKTEVYSKIYKSYKNYLAEHFSLKELTSIYYHEIVHWLRLMPYKIRKNERLAVVFYVGMLNVLEDVWEIEHGQK